MEELTSKAENPVFQILGLRKVSFGRVITILKVRGDDRTLSAGYWFNFKGISEGDFMAEALA